MGTSPSQQAGIKAGNDVFYGVYDAVAAELSDSYVYLSTRPGIDLPALSSFKDDEEYRAFISVLATEVLENETDRAKRIREERKKLKPKDPDIPLMTDLYGASRAARHAVSNNTGDFEFLGGSTIMNALYGLLQAAGQFIKWILSGFKKEEMPSLTKTIGRTTVDSTVNEFGNVMAQQHVQPELAAVLKAEMKKEGEIKAGLRPASDATPRRRLSDIKKPAEKKYSAFDNLDNDEKKKQALITHYTELGDNMLATLPPDAVADGLGDKFRAALKEQAIKVFEANKGKKLTPEQVEQMDKEVLQGTLSAIVPELEKKPALKPMIASVKAMEAALKDPANKSIKAAMDSLTGTPDKEQAKLLLRMIGSPMLDTKRTGPFVDLLEKAGMLDAAGKAAATEKLKESGKSVAPVNWRDEVSKQIRKALQKEEVASKFSTATIRSNLDKAITAAVNDRAGWAGGAVDSVGGTAKKGLQWLGDTLGSDSVKKFADSYTPPTDEERNRLSEFVHNHLPGIIEKKAVEAVLKTGVPPDPGKVDTTKLAAAVVKEFESKLSGSTDVDAVWKKSKNLEMLKGFLKKELEDGLKDSFKGIKMQVGALMPRKRELDVDFDLPRFEVATTQGPEGRKAKQTPKGFTTPISQPALAFT